jgi:hypothetical protein
MFGKNKQFIPHYFVSFMMILVMLSAVLLSGFHQHDVGDHSVVEQGCDICVFVKQTGAGVLPALLAVIVALTYRFVARFHTFYIFIPATVYTASSPRAPPVV